jgi:hypothetical protein
MSSSTSRGRISGALRLDDFKFQFVRQPGGWPGGKVTTDMPGMVNIRQDPFERTPSINSENLNNLGGGYMNDFYARSSGGSSSSSRRSPTSPRRPSTIRRCRTRLLQPGGGEAADRSGGQEQTWTIREEINVHS